MSLDHSDGIEGMKTHKMCREPSEDLSLGQNHLVEYAHSDRTRNSREESETAHQRRSMYGELEYTHRA